MSKKMAVFYRKHELSMLPTCNCLLEADSFMIATFHFWSSFRNVLLSQNNEMSRDKNHFFTGPGSVDTLLPQNLFLRVPDSFIGNDFHFARHGMIWNDVKSLVAANITQLFNP